MAITKKQKEAILASRRDPTGKKTKYFLTPVEPSRRIEAKYAEIINGAISKTRDSVLRLYSTSNNLKTISANLDRLFDEMDWWTNLSLSMKEVMGDLDAKHRNDFYKILSDRMGINVAGFVNENQLGEVLDNIVFDNVEKSKIVGNELEARVREIVRRSLVGQEEKSPSLESQLKELFKGKKKNAKMIARDQTQRAVNALNQARQQAAGIKKYKWLTSLDNRVRHGKFIGKNKASNHRIVHGAIISWDTGKILESINSSIIGKTVKMIANGHPGQDYNCRCTAKPILEV